MINDKAKAAIFLQAETNMMANGRITKCMAKGSINGQMDKNMMEIF